MATMRNPINRNHYLDVTEMVKDRKAGFGLIANSGLFKETPVKSHHTMYKVEVDTNKTMTKLTSRTERDAVHVSKGKSKQVTVSGVTIKEEGSVHVEDVQNQLTQFDIETDQSFANATLDRLNNMHEVWSQNMEYMHLRTTQGYVCDPEDGSVVTDMFAVNGVTKQTKTIDISQASQTILSSLVELRNQLVKLNNGNGMVGVIEIPVSSEVFGLLSTHPELIAQRQLAFTGTGAQAMNDKFLNKSIANISWTEYGYRQEMMLENFLFYTYPNQFTHMDGTAYIVGEGNKSWTIVRGATNCYEVDYAPAPYVSELGGLGKKILARSTGIIKDTHIDMTIESHPVFVMKRPEMAIEITWKTT